MLPAVAALTSPAEALCGKSCRVESSAGVFHVHWPSAHKLACDAKCAGWLDGGGGRAAALRLFGRVYDSHVVRNGTFDSFAEDQSGRQAFKAVNKPV